MNIHGMFAESARIFLPLIISHLWQATIFAIIALVVCALLRRGPAQVRYLICLLALAKFLLPAALFTPIATQLPINKFVDESRLAIPLPTPAIVYDQAPPPATKLTPARSVVTTTSTPATHHYE